MMTRLTKPTLLLSAAALLWLGACGGDADTGVSTDDLSQQACALKGTCNKCLRGEIGDLFPSGPATTANCKVTSAWKTIAAANCKRAGLTLVEFQAQSACSCETGSTDHFRFVSYRCCPATPPPPPPQCKPDDPSTPLVNEDTCGPGAKCVGGICVKDPPAPPSCIKQTQGGPTSCKSTATWKQYAYDACKAKGLLLGNYTPRDSCGKDTWRYVDYTCCKQSPPPPPPQCKPDDPNTPLVNEDTCGNGATCINGVCVAPPPLKVQVTATTSSVGTRQCVTEDYWAFGVCGTSSQWNSYKAGRIKLCQSQGWVVNSSSVGKPCSGGYLDASMQCCEPK